MHSECSLCFSAVDTSHKSAVDVDLDVVEETVPEIEILDEAPDEDDAGDEDLMEPAFDPSPQYLLERFQKDTVDKTSSRQLFRVCRLDGIEDLRKDIFGAYKNPALNLRAVPRVRFEDEDGVGSGPVREFLTSALKVVDEGIPSRSKPLIFLEGEQDHRLPIYDRSLRLSGAFKAVGRILGHSALHGGSSFCGLSAAVVHYWTLGKETEVPPPISVRDLPDLELRELISQV